MAQVAQDGRLAEKALQIAATLRCDPRRDHLHGDRRTVGPAHGAATRRPCRPRPVADNDVVRDRLALLADLLLAGRTDRRQLRRERLRLAVTVIPPEADTAAVRGQHNRRLRDLLQFLFGNLREFVLGFRLRRKANRGSTARPVRGDRPCGTTCPRPAASCSTRPRVGCVGHLLVEGQPGRSCGRPCSAGRRA